MQVTLPGKRVGWLKDVKPLYCDHASLVRDGWQRRSVAKGERLREIEALYAELGFEVLALPFAENGVDGEASCTACFTGEGGEMLVYTRPGK